MANKNENIFQEKLKAEIKKRFPGAIILKNDPNLVQGIPDLIILYKNKWVALECKKSTSSDFRPNQEWYLDKMNKMSYASMISPENKEDILNAISKTFKSRRTTRLSGSE